MAAEEVFSREGLDASLDSIARLAGVGNATLYRRFPTREDLIGQIYLKKIEVQIDWIEEKKDTDDPWQALIDHIGTLLKFQLQDIGMAQMLLRGPDEYESEEVRTRLEVVSKRAFALVSALASGAIAQGKLREDFLPEQIGVMLAAHMSIATRPYANRELVSEAFRQMVINSIAADPAGEAPRSYTPDEIRLALGFRKRPTENATSA